jgi:large subunit ribosomal protein L13
MATKKAPAKEAPPAVVPLVVDVSNQVAGRVASAIAKQLLQGENVVVINAEKAVVSGNRAGVVLAWKDQLGLRTATSPWKGPFHAREPHMILHRIIRGMIPWNRSGGRLAMKRLRVYVGTPEGLTITRRLELHGYERTGRRTVYLGDIARELGWKGSS